MGWVAQSDKRYEYTAKSKLVVIARPFLAIEKHIFGSDRSSMNAYVSLCALKRNPKRELKRAIKGNV